MAKTPTPKPASAIDTPTPTPVPAAQPWAQPTAAVPPTEPVPPVTAPVEPVAAVEPIAAEPIPSTEPLAGTPLTAEEREANGLPPIEAEQAGEDEVEAVEPEAALNAPAPEDVPPVEDKLTLGRGDEEDNLGEVPVAEDEPTGDDGRPDGFIPGDQTAAGALTPPGGQHPGAPKGLLPGQSPNLQDPYNVNGTQRNHELLAAGHGIKNPLLDEPDPNVEAAKSDADEAKDD